MTRRVRVWRGAMLAVVVAAACWLFILLALAYAGVKPK